MKKSTFLNLLLFLLCFKLHSQNLILNPGFEIGSIPTDTYQIANARNWFSYITAYDTLNGSNSWYSPNLFDTKANFSNCYVLHFYNLILGKADSIPIVGIPQNYLTLYNDIVQYQQLNSINPRNAGNTRFAGLEAYMYNFSNGVQTPVNRAIEGSLSETLNNNFKNKFYKISFWAAAASYISYMDSVDAGIYHLNNDFIDISLIDNNGKETSIINSNLDSGYGPDSNIFILQPIKTYNFCTDPNECVGFHYSPYPIGHWDYYEALFYMDSTKYKYSYANIAFKLNRLTTGGNDVPDVFIDDVGLYEINDTNKIIIQPDTLVYCANKLNNIDSAWFALPAIASKNINYTWQHDTTGSGGWVNLNPAITNLTISQELLYSYRWIHSGYNYFRCIITSGKSSVTTDVGTLYVVPSPTVSISSQDQISNCTPEELLATASNTTYSYQWIKNNRFDTSTWQNTYRIDTAGVYRCVVHNSCGITDTSNAITVNQSPVITTNTDTIITCPGYPGSTIKLNASITGGMEPYEYEWDNFSTNIKDSTNSSLTINTDSLNIPEVYTCIVGDANNCATSKTIALINFYASPDISEQPNSIIICKGDTTKFSIVTADTGISYQWCRVHKEFIPPHLTIIIDDGINGATKNKYIIPVTTPGDTGIYTCLLTNIYGCTTTSEYVTLTLHTQPIITQQPDSAFICSGDTAEFSIIASGDSLNYQWYRTAYIPSFPFPHLVDLPIKGATNSNLFIIDTSKTDTGYYRCAVTNKYGCTVKSQYCKLSIITSPTLTVKANNSAVEYIECPRGGTLELNLTANATGGENCTGNWEYSWFNGNKYWDGTAFNSLIAKWNESYENISFTATDTAIYTVTVRCDSMAACSNSNSSVKVVILKDIAYLDAVIGNPANGKRNVMEVSWNKVEGASYELEFSKDNSTWSRNLLKPDYNDTSYTDTIVDYPNSPCFYQVKTYVGTVSCGDWFSILDTAFTACDNPVLSDSSATDNTITLKLLNDSNPAYTLYAIHIDSTHFVEIDSSNVHLGHIGNWEEYRAMKEWNTITVQGLRPDSNYCFYAIAKNKRGDLRPLIPQLVCKRTGECVPLTLSPPVAKNISKCAGDSVTLSVEASGTMPYTYQWLKNGSDVEGAYSSTVTLKNLVSDAGGVYNCRISNYCGTDTSGNITLVVNSKPIINTTLKVYHKLAGGSVTFSVSATGGGDGATYSYHLLFC